MVKKRNILVAVAGLAIISAILPWYSVHMQNKALDQASLGMRVESLHTASKASSLDPFSITALFTLAGAQQRIGWQQEARQTLLKATEIEPENYQTWEQLALYEKNYWNMPADAKAHFEKAIELNPQEKSLKIEAGLLPADS